MTNQPGARGRADKVSLLEGNRQTEQDSPAGLPLIAPLPPVLREATLTVESLLEGISHQNPW